MTEAGSFDSLAAVRAMAHELTETVGMARALASCGRVVDLTGLDQQIGLLCAKSLDLAPDEGRGLRPHLIVLSVAMDTLSLVLAAQAAPSG